MIMENKTETTIMGNQTEKNMEHEMEAETCWGGLCKDKRK